MELKITDKIVVEEKFVEKAVYKFELVDENHSYGQGTFTFNSLELEAPRIGNIEKVISKYIKDMTSSLNTLGDVIVKFNTALR
jgi:hypothetical protein